MVQMSGTGRSERVVLRAGTIVQVRTEDEIFATLDASGRLDGLPFMPEMLPLCGQTLRVFKRADKTCDSIWAPGMRRMESAIFLWGARCDGRAHGGCQAGCLFFWKEAWLRPPTSEDGSGEQTLVAVQSADTERTAPRCTVDDLVRATKVPASNGDVYSCQATEIGKATTPLPSSSVWNLREYATDVGSGNVTARYAARVVVTQAVSVTRNRVSNSRIGQALLVPIWRLARRSRRTAGAQRVRHAVRAEALNLQPGDRVRVRSRSEIEATLDRKRRNRGLSFNAEMLRYCGNEFQVLRRVDRIIHEQSGKMIELRDCIVLDGVTCKGDYHRFCPRDVYMYWREGWLQKLD